MGKSLLFPKEAQGMQIKKKEKKYMPFFFFPKDFSFWELEKRNRQRVF